MNLYFFSLFAMFTVVANNARDTRTVSNGEDIGIYIMGSIIGSDPNANVALIKNLKTDKVTAVTIGRTIASKFEVEAVTEEYILLFDKKSQKAHRKFSHFIKITQKS